MSYNRRATDDLDEELELGELGVAEYVVCLLAFDTYLRYLGEISAPFDDVARRGLVVLKAAERLHQETIFNELNKDLPSDNHRKMLSKAFRYLPTPDGLTQRSFQLRTTLSRGGASTMRAVFQTNRALLAVREAINASMSDDGDAALDKFAAIPITKNPKMRDWIDLAAKTAGSGSYQNAVAVSSQDTSDDASKILDARIQQQGTSATSIRGAEEDAKSKDDLTRVEVDATEAARKAMEVSGQADIPPARSEVVGIATAVAIAAASDPLKDANIPEPLRKLDPEQRAAAITDGRVLVAAGAGAGKSTTLVARIKYLVENKKVNPSRVLACSFNAKAADELKENIAKALGYEVQSTTGVHVGTMHSLFYKFIVGDRQMPGFGTPEEQAMLRAPRLIAPPKKGVNTISPATLSIAIRNTWKSCDPKVLAAHMGVPEDWFEGDPPKAKKVGLVINGWQGNDVPLAQAREEGKTSKALAKAALWYEMYLGIKGDIPGWRPPCGPSKAIDNFNDRHRKGSERLGDLDDMLKIFRDILRRDPKARKTIQGSIDHILVDEAQDLNLVQHQIFEMMSEHVSEDSKDKSLWMVGDDKQCCHEDTPVATHQGVRRLGDIQAGDKVLAYRNGEIKEQPVRHVMPSTWGWGYKVVTESGKTLTMSPNHKIWATDPVLEGEQHLVYLMFRRDKGYRVGVTNCNSYDRAGFSYGQRPQAEKAERLWVLGVSSTREGAHVEEACYSLRYQIPTHLFHTDWKCRAAMNTDKIDAVFTEFGRNGDRLLEALGLSFDYPNWMCRNSETNVARTIQLLGHGPKGTQVSLEWGSHETDLHDLTDAKILAGGQRRLRKWFLNYREGLAYAELLANKTGLNLSQRLSVEDQSLRKVTAASLVPGMSVAVRDGEHVTLEGILLKEKAEGRFLDLDVEDASNFFGGDILSSNSIYQFRGAKPELFVDLDGKAGWKTRMIQTNYRCEPEIVEAANRLAAFNEDQIPMEARANPQKGRGAASIVVEIPTDNAAGAIATIGRIRKDMDVDGAQPEDYAVLARTNAELNDFETACIINEIPYVRRGGKGFLESPESKAVLGYIDLAAGYDYEKKKSSLIAVLMKPDRGTFLRAEDIEKAVDEAIDDVARSERVDKKFVDPAILLDSRYVRILADRLKQPWRLKMMASSKDARTGEWMYGKRVDELADNLRGLRANIDDLRRTIEVKNPSTDELLNYTLDNMTSVVSGYDKATKRPFTTTATLREQITNDTAIFSDDDGDDDEDETTPKGEVGEEGQMVLEEKKKEQKGLGAVQFLFALAEPNPNDQKHNTDPSTAQGFVRKIARYSDLADTLRIDPVKFAKAQEKIADPGQRKSKPPAINLSTVHSVKGAEWPNVTVLMPKGVFPPERKPDPDEPPPSEEYLKASMKAERNLAYVALTRAAKNLEILGGKKGLSRFVHEAGLRPGQNVEKRGPEGEPEVRTASTDAADAFYVAETLAMYGDEIPPVYSYHRSVS